MLARRAPLAQRFAKDVMRRSMGLSQDEALRLESRSFYDLGQTEDLREGTAAFREKRKPLFVALIGKTKRNIKGEANGP